MARLLSFSQMAAQTNVDARLVARIKELVEAHKVIIKAVCEGQTFVACNASKVFSYDAVLHVSTGRRHIVIDAKNRPNDILAKVADILTQEAKRYGKIS